VPKEFVTRKIACGVHYGLKGVRRYKNGKLLYKKRGLRLLIRF